MSDLLSTARTPTNEEVGIVQACRDFDDTDEQLAITLLKRAAPRILILAYREAARLVRENHLISGSIGPLMNIGWGQCQEACAAVLESQAAALEKEVPNG